MSEETLNIDPHEVAKFDALASRWWDPQSEFKPLHDINPLRLDYIDQHAGLAGKKVLDIGCGGGILAEAMARQGAEVTAIDMAAAPLEVARLHLLESDVSVDYQQMTAEQMAVQSPQQWDIVTCMELLEHVPNPASLVKACAQLVKPGGFVFLSTINRHPKAYVYAILGAEYILKMLPKGTHDYAKFIRPSELGRYLRQAELELINITGLSYNPISQQYSLGSNVDVNYMLTAVKPVESV